MNGQMINIPTCATTIPRRHTTTSDAFLLEDAVDEWMAEEDPSCNESLVTMRQSRDTMNRLRSARGFLMGKIDGVLEESNGPGMQKGKGQRQDQRKRQRTRSTSREMQELWSHRPRVSRLPADAGRWWFELFQHRSTKSVDAEIEWKGQRRRSKGETTVWHVGDDSRCWTPRDTTYSNTQTRPESFPVEATFDDALISVQHQSYTLIDSGCTAAIAGREWLENIAEKLKHYHLQPFREDTYQSFTGLGGAKRESHRKWILPTSISGKHTTQAYHEISGNMIGLTSREDLERWGCNLHLRSHEVHADFETLNIYGKSLLRLPNGHAVLDIMDYDEKHVLDDHIFQPFVTGKKGSSALLAFEAVIPKDTFLSDRLARNDDEETTWVQEAIRSGTKGIYSKKVTTELDRLARTYRTMSDVMRDDGSTFMWELSSHGSQLTKVSTHGGHRAVTPSSFQEVIKTGQLQYDLVKLISHFKPWLVVILTEDEASSHEDFCVGFA